MGESLLLLILLIIGAFIVIFALGFSYQMTRRYKKRYLNLIKKTQFRIAELAARIAKFEEGGENIAGNT